MIKWLKGMFSMGKENLFSLKHAELDLDADTAKLVMNHPNGMMLAASLVNMLIELEAENYLEVRFRHAPTGELYSCLIQRVEGKTPAELNIELKARIAELEDE